MNQLLLRTVLALLLSTVDAVAIADSNNGTWTANPKFRIEDSSYRETLTFISGVSYALSTSASELVRENKQNYFCLPRGSSVGSKLLIEILNENHSGSITPEKAIETIVQGLKKRYPC